MLSPRRLGVPAAVAVVTVAVDVVTKGWADARLPGAPVELGIGRLQVDHNTGVAFSMGSALPTWVVLGLASMITIGVVVGIMLDVLRPAVAAGSILGGAVANIVDRAGDGRVTDFLWLGWFPTFNLADVAITLGGVALVWASWRGDSRRADGGDDGPDRRGEGSVGWAK